CWAQGAALRPRVAYVPERPRFFDWMTVAEIGWFTAGFHSKEYLPRYEEWIRKFELEAKAKLGRLSKGQYAKVGLALALALDPEAPDAALLGNVLQRNGAGKQWQAIVQDLRAEAVETLRRGEGIHDLETAALGLEEIYCALLARKEAP